MRSMTYSVTLALLLTLSGCGKLADDSPSGDGSVDAHDAASRDVGQETTGDTSDASEDDMSAGDALSGPPDGEISLGPNCGRPGQSCCPYDGCYSDGCCVDGQCVAKGDDCGHSLGACTNGGCGGCGALGQPCCMEDVSPGCSDEAGACVGCTQTGTYCTASDAGPEQCTACGGIGQQCCELGTGGCGFVAGVNYYCNDRFSLCFLNEAGADPTCESSCGGVGQPCCEYNDCLDGACCLAGPTGTLCFDSSTCGCTAGKCTTCGRIGVECCTYALCAVEQGQMDQYATCEFGSEGPGTCRPQ
jgi:hypothetical protein